jgi:Bacterial SH3 domain
MRYAAILAALVVACHQAPAEKTDTREPIAVQYVGAPELLVHKWAKDESPVVTKFLNGESVAILSRRGDWVEVRTVTGSGFAHAADLTNGTEAKSEEGNPTARFRLAPSPVTAPGAKGTIYIEADVNTDGDVTAERVITDTTNSPDLAARNSAALQRAKFYPIVQKGEKKPFLYYYRVDY